MPSRRGGSKRLLGALDPQLEIQELVDFDGRWPGTDAERRAAVHLKEKLERLGRGAEIEPIQIRPNWPVAYALIAVAAVVGSVISVKLELLGVVLLLLATVAAFAELTLTFLAARVLTGRRASQNVLSREQSDKPGTLVLMAHYDAARTGAVFSRRSLERTATLQKAIKRPIGPFAPFVWSIVVVLVCALARFAGLHGLVLTIVQFIPTVLLIVERAAADRHRAVGRRARCQRQRLRRGHRPQARRALRRRARELRPLGPLPRRRGGPRARLARLDPDAQERARPAEHRLRQRGHRRPRHSALGDEGGIRVPALLPPELGCEPA